MSKGEWVIQLIKVALGIIAFTYFAWKIEVIISLLR